MEVIANPGKYPNGTRVNNWSLFEEKQKGKTYWVIRRKIFLPHGKSKNERYPVKLFERFRDDYNELEKFVVRLNDRIPEEMRTRQEVKLKHAYIDPSILNAYLEKLRSEIPTERGAKKEYGYLVRYFLNFFINKLGSRDPIRWKLKEDVWSRALRNDFLDDNDRAKHQILDPGEKLSASVIRTTINQANRFIKFLHSHRPDAVQPVEFAPISKAMYKKYEAERQLNGLVIERKYIKDEEWKKIEANLPSTIRPMIMLCYHFGLRRSESMGLELTDITHGILKVRRQLIANPDDGPKFGPLKGRDPRKVPYWFATPKQAYTWTKDIIDRNLYISSDTLTDYWNKYMDKIDMDYDIHDLRHTWCTKGGRIVKVPRELQLAAGHKDLRTTMKYMKDDQAPDETVWIPDEE